MTTNRDLWNVKSIYDFQYFNCPSCSSKKYASKQDFVNHLGFNHPESIEYLKEISDGSLSNILQPWGDENVAINVKYKVEEESDNIEIDYFNNDVEQEDDLMDIKDDNLATNVTINIPEENFNICDSCGNTFTKSGDLKKHIKTIHEGQRNYKCDSCGKTFTESGNMHKHIRTIHEGQRNYKCDSCGKLFNRTENLKKHIETIHGGQSNKKCEFCGKLFFNPLKLRDHSCLKCDFSDILMM